MTIHPVAQSALEYLQTQRTKFPKQWFMLKESIASASLAEDSELTEILLETINRLEKGETVGDVYVLGLAWFYSQNIEPIMREKEREHEREKEEMNDEAERDEIDAMRRIEEEREYQNYEN